MIKRNLKDKYDYIVNYLKKINNFESQNQRFSLKFIFDD